MNSRDEVENELGKLIPSGRVVKFLLKNLHRKNDGTFSWSLNLHALKDNLPHILTGMNEKDFEKGNGITGFPVLFVKGADSEYITANDQIKLIPTIFPYAEIVTIPNAGHWVHAEQPALLLKNLMYFILD